MERLTTRHSGVAVIKDKSNPKEVMEKLARYEELEEEGKLKEFPCAIGNPIWEVVKDEISERVFMTEYEVEDISQFQVKYAGCWIDRNFEGTELFYDKVTAEERYRALNSELN